MDCKQCLKLICLISYILWVVLVPGLPNYYTFTVSTIAYILTLLASVSILDFLYTRPIAQKTLLNRLLVLFVLTLGLASTRTYALNFITCWFHPQLIRFVDNHPYFATTVFPLQSYTILVGGVFISLCTSRLLLIAKPAFYHNSNPNLWLFFVGIGSICVCISNSIYSLVTCRNYGHGKNIRLLQLVKTELGLLDDNSESYNRSKGIDTIDVVEYSENYNYTDSANFNTTLNSTNCSQHEKTFEHISECTILPMVPILGTCAVCLEIARIILAIVKAIRKRKNKVGQKKMKQTMNKKNCMKMTSKSTSQKKFHQTKSVPEILRMRSSSLELGVVPEIPNSTVRTLRMRSSSLELGAVPEIPNSTVTTLRMRSSSLELGAVPPMPLPTPAKPLKVRKKYPNPKEKTESLEVIVKNTIKTMCMRSATIALIFAIVGIVAVCVDEFSTKNERFSSFGRSMNIAAARLVYYCLAVCMFMCDEDVLTYTWKKFKCQDQVHPFLASA